MDYTVHGILQARILEWVAFPFSRGSFQPRDWTQVSRIAGRFFTSWATREAQEYWSGYHILSPADLPNPGIKLGSPALQVDSLPAELPGKELVLFSWVLSKCFTAWHGDGNKVGWFHSLIRFLPPQNILFKHQWYALYLTECAQNWKKDEPWPTPSKNLELST